MLSFENYPKEVKAMQDIIDSGKYFSVTFIKMDKTIRYVNGHKKIYQSNSPETELRGKYNRMPYRILLVWDNNKINDKTGEKGSYVSAKLDRLLYFKSGQVNLDFTAENSIAISDSGVTPEQLEQIKAKMKIGDIVEEEITEMFK